MITFTKIKYTAVSAGVTTGPTTHASYTGLTADDHPQYASHKFQRSFGYVAGGENASGNTGRTEKYDDVANTWTNKTSLNVARRYLGEFSTDGYGYAAGGTNSAGNKTGSTEKYDDVANTWTNKTTLTVQKDNKGFALNGFGYAPGGYSAAETSEVEKYDDVANTWTVKTGMNITHNGADSFSLNGFGYVAGGSTTGGALTTVTEKYDDVANTWTNKSAINTARAQQTGFSLNGYGYSVGGNSGTATITTEKYDDVANMWTAKTGMNVAKNSGAAFSLNGYGYAAGGYTGAAYTSAVEKYDDVANTWTVKLDMNLDRDSGVSGFSNGQLTDTNYFDPNIVNILRKISYRAVVVGSYSTSATSSGICVIAHGLGTAPVIAWAIPVATGTTVGAVRIGLSALTGTNIDFIVTSCPINTAASTTSSISTKFIWGAQP